MKLILTLVMMLGAPFSFSSVKSDTQCALPTPPLFKAHDVDVPLKVTLITDYAGFNSDLTDSLFPATVAVTDEHGAIDYLPVYIKQRGNSRLYCDAKPFVILFLNQEIEARLEERLRLDGYLPTDPLYIKAYYDLFVVNLPKTESFLSQKKNIFAKIGDDVKVVTHCGKSSWEFVGGDTVAAQNAKLFSELTLYQMVAALRLPVEWTRLAEFTYLEKNGSFAYSDVDESGHVVHAKWGFFREPPKSLASRCGLQHKFPQGMTEGVINQTSEFQAHFINKFLMCNDYVIEYGHNINELYNQFGHVHYAPYDFDLSGVFLPEYDKNYGYTPAQHLNLFIPWIRTQTLMPVATEQIFLQNFLTRVLTAEPEMQLSLDQARLVPERKMVFQVWFTQTMDALKKLAVEINP